MNSNHSNHLDRNFNENKEIFEFCLRDKLESQYTDNFTVTVRI